MPPIVHEVLRSPGQPLDPATRAFMEPRFGHDFGRVRVHADRRAAESAGAVNALAYTVGHHVAFGEGRFAPETSVGRGLIAHELAHVVQQRQGGPVPNRSNTASHEREASDIADKTIAGATRLNVQSGTSMGMALNGGRPLPALSVEEQFRFLFNQMGFTSAPPGPPLVDPGGTGAGVGTARTPGYQVHAAVQVVDPLGRQVHLGYGAYLGGGGLHGEEQVIVALRNSLPTDESLRGGRMIVTVTQDPCGPDRHNCNLQLNQLARDYGLELETYVPDRDPVRGGSGVRPPTAARGAQRTDRPPVRYRRLDPPASMASGGSVPSTAVPESPTTPRTKKQTPTPSPGVPGAAQAGEAPVAAGKGPFTSPTAPKTPAAPKPLTAAPSAIEAAAAKVPPAKVTGSFKTRIRSGLRTAGVSAGVSAGFMALGVVAALIRGWGAESILRKQIEKLEPAINARLAAHHARIAEIESTGGQAYAKITFTSSVIQNMAMQFAFELGPSTPYVDPDSLQVDVMEKKIPDATQSEWKHHFLHMEEITTHTYSIPLLLVPEETP